MDLPLETLDIRCTSVSVPSDTAFREWLGGITFRRVCPPPPSPPPPPPPSPPEQVMGVGVMEGVEQLLVSWDPVSEADGYKVQWKSGSQQFDSSRQHIASASTTSYTISSNLDAGREYVVRVIATKSGADDGTPSREVAGTPRAADTTPPPQQQPTTTGQGGGGCSIASNAGTGNTPESIVFNLLLIVFVLVSVVFPEKGSETIFMCPAGDSVAVSRVFFSLRFTRVCRKDSAEFLYERPRTHVYAAEKKLLIAGRYLLIRNISERGG